MGDIGIVQARYEVLSETPFEKAPTERSDGEPAGPPAPDEVPEHAAGDAER